MLFIGIDPGKSGAIAWVDSSGEDYGVFTLDATERDTWEGLRDLVANAAVPVRAAIEQVAARPGQGVSSMFSFGMSFGFLRGCLVASGAPFFEYVPTKWQRTMGLTKKYSSKTVRKNAHKALAQQIFPKANITHKTADALLIAETLRRRTTV